MDSSLNVSVEISPIKQNNYCIKCKQYYCSKSAFENHMNTNHENEMNNSTCYESRDENFPFLS